MITLDASDVHVPRKDWILSSLTPPVPNRFSLFSHTRIKAIHVDHNLGDLERDKTLSDNDEVSPTREHSKTQQKTFLRELEAMIRLWSPYTVNMYGAVTSRKDRLVLVI